MANTANSGEGVLHLIGVGVMHSIAPLMHNSIASALGKPWKFSSLECPTISDVQAVLKLPQFKGGVITMPYKQSIIPLLSGIDDQAVQIGAVNNVYFAPDGQIRGTNTDWEGVLGCLLSGDAERKGEGKPALVIGAGGASRAAVFALKSKLQCNTIYVINRDEKEVAQLLADTTVYGEGALKIVHIQSVKQAQEVSTPFYVVGTVPDFEPKSDSEIDMRNILEEFLKRPEKGVLLDMCFKPRNTRTLKLGRSQGWKCVEGTGVIGWQIETQWGLWTREDVSQTIPKAQAWKVLNTAAEESKAINF